MGIFAYKCARCRYPTGDPQTWTSQDGAGSKGSVVRLECTDGRVLFVRGAYDGQGMVELAREGAEDQPFLSAIDAQFQVALHWIESASRERVLVSSGVYCDGIIEQWDEDGPPTEHHYCSPADATLLDAVPNDAVPFLPTIPPIARLFVALGAPSPGEAIREGKKSSVPDASRVRAILDAHPLMDLSLGYKFLLGPETTFLSFALEKDDPETVFALVSSGRVQVDDFRVRYLYSYGWYGIDQDPFSWFSARPTLSEASLAVRFVGDVEERGGIQVWRADVRRVFAGLRYLLQKGRITVRHRARDAATARLDGVVWTRISRRCTPMARLVGWPMIHVAPAVRSSSPRGGKPVAALVRLLSSGDDVLRLVLDYAIDASSTRLLPTKAGCVVNHANSARSDGQARARERYNAKELLLREVVRKREIALQRQRDGLPPLAPDQE